ncbi:MAG: hypothetical protein MZV70_60440 [Desulfobacterales bacterium]|nr:hypothetical protein [Desulfobacterales bacterium]
MRKGITLGAGRGGRARRAPEAGVTALASFILGLPGETPETIRETMDFARRLEAHGLIYGFHLLAPFPGTDVRERSAELRPAHPDRRLAPLPRQPRRRGNRDGRLRSMLDRDRGRLGGPLHPLPRRHPGAHADRAGPTAEEAHQLTNLERIVLVYDLMMNRTSSKRVGAWRGPREEALERARPARAAGRSRPSAATADPTALGDGRGSGGDLVVRARARERCGGAGRMRIEARGPAAAADPSKRGSPPNFSISRSGLLGEIVHPAAMEVRPRRSATSERRLERLAVAALRRTAMRRPTTLATCTTSLSTQCASQLVRVVVPADGVDELLAGSDQFWRMRAPIVGVVGAQHDVLGHLEGNPLGHHVSDAIRGPSGRNCPARACRCRAAAPR